MASHPREWAFLAALVVAMVIFHWARRQFWVFSLLVLPGTFAHESSHWVLGLLLNGQPRTFTLMPHREAGGWVMGSVALTNLRWYNAFFIGMAPLLLLPLAYWAMTWRLGLTPGFSWQEALAVYLIANLAYASIPSWQDVKASARSPLGWLLLGAGLLWAYSTQRPKPSPVIALQKATRS